MDAPSLNTDNDSLQARYDNTEGSICTVTMMDRARAD